MKVMKSIYREIEKEDQDYIGVTKTPFNNRTAKRIIVERFCNHKNTEEIKRIIKDLDCFPATTKETKYKAFEIASIIDDHVILERIKEAEKILPLKTSEAHDIFVPLQLCLADLARKTDFFQCPGGELWLWKRRELDEKDPLKKKAESFFSFVERLEGKEEKERSMLFYDLSTKFFSKGENNA